MTSPFADPNSTENLAQDDYNVDEPPHASETLTPFADPNSTENLAQDDHNVDEAPHAGETLTSVQDRTVTPAEAYLSVRGDHYNTCTIDVGSGTVNVHQPTKSRLSVGGDIYNHYSISLSNGTFVQSSRTQNNCNYEIEFTNGYFTQNFKTTEGNNYKINGTNINFTSQEITTPHHINIVDHHQKSQETSASRGRNLVLCFDGSTTGNHFDEESISNVARMYELLRKDSADQFCYYQPGIGSCGGGVPLQKLFSWFSKFKLSKAANTLSSSHESGIRKDVLSGYKFLMTHYRSNDDNIYMFGFSRGAYIARVLCGMLEKVGLLSSGNDEQVNSAWDMYEGKNNDDLAVNFQDVFSRRVQIRFLGLWDAVKRTKHTFLEPKTDSFVSYVYHALALDERRIDFQPHHYTKPMQTQQSLPDTPTTKVFERWFVGDHTDVGGLFPLKQLDRPALANPPFRWIVWAAAHAAGNLPLLFDLRAFYKYASILIYSRPDETINVNDLVTMTPADNSKKLVGGDDNRDQPHDMDLPITTGLTPTWTAARLLNRESRNGVPRDIEGAILHVSVGVKLDKDKSYGGSRRAELERLVKKADEVVHTAHADEAAHTVPIEEV